MEQQVPRDRRHRVQGDRAHLRKRQFQFRCQWRHQSLTGPVQKSLVRIYCDFSDPDYKRPWNAGGLERGVGAGFVISGNRIMTNAHVVANSRYVTVERDGDPNKYPAKVQFIANDCDLAVITVSAPDFFKNMLPVQLAGFLRWNRPFRRTAIQSEASGCRSLPGSCRGSISSSIRIHRSISIWRSRSARRLTRETAEAR
jgi:hypothetical protein